MGLLDLADGELVFLADGEFGRGFGGKAVERNLHASVGIAEEAGVRVRIVLLDVPGTDGVQVYVYRADARAAGVFPLLGAEDYQDGLVFGHGEEVCISEMTVGCIGSNPKDT